MKSHRFLFLFLSLILIAFVSFSVRPLPAQQDRSSSDRRATNSKDESPTVNGLVARLKQNEEQKKRSLESVRKIHDHPLYVMNYYGDYDWKSPRKVSQVPSQSADDRWACSLFVAFGNKKQPLYGRNFDWQNNPALLLFSDPPNAYASISMVDVSYLGYSRKDEKFNDLQGRKNLLIAPLIPFDGMNEHGLTVGMAAVPTVGLLVDKNKPTVGSLQIIRIMLNEAKTVDEALKLIRKHNIHFSGGPQIHYLIADAEGNSAIAEIKNKKLNIIRGTKPWSSATNFHLTGNEGKETQLCRRYAQIQSLMKQKKGVVSIDEAFKLLKNVSQKSTRWSVVYDIKNQTAHISMSRNFNKRMKYKIRDLEASKKTSK